MSLCLKAIKALRSVTLPDLCGVLWLGDHPCLLQDLWPRPPYGWQGSRLMLKRLRRGALGNCPGENLEMGLLVRNFPQP